ncbi:hypothetical protein CORC01_09660 [Colletotrichum orchidophilum]|uniref:Secreted protein n=1 Tax=Colletotrichum orchidophilum TaxID=1209926 RepID=A0A1G4B0Y0_9PEZI|nr:uncharacterized protein CORC01_09660 [Colletotrichum orchidophilum]OHE95003.1 hypothetical protein CORC01_09660 [Colletotrichum orchidophilum]
MLFHPSLAIVALLQFALPASATFYYCEGALIGGGCPDGFGTKTSTFVQAARKGALEEMCQTWVQIAASSRTEPSTSFVSALE